MHVLCVVLVAALAAAEGRATKMAPKATCAKCPKANEEDEICAVNAKNQTKNFDSECELKRANCLSPKDSKLNEASHFYTWDKSNQVALFYKQHSVEQ